MRARPVIPTQGDGKHQAGADYRPDPEAGGAAVNGDQKPQQTEIHQVVGEDRDLEDVSEHEGGREPHGRGNQPK
jgi:hypothetical protein